MDLRINLMALKKCVINSTGNVGIGTTDPRYELDVNGQGADIVNNDSSMERFIPTIKIP